MQDKINFKELSEQIQDDLISLLDGQDQKLIDHACQIVVEKIKNQLKTSLIQ